MVLIVRELRELHELSKGFEQRFLKKFALEGIEGRIVWAAAS